MRKLTVIVFSLIFLVVAFVPAYAQTQTSPSPYSLMYSGFGQSSLKPTIHLIPPPTDYEITINNILDLVAPETFTKDMAGLWFWKYDGYDFEGYLPKIQMYWVEKDSAGGCYIPVFYMGYDLGRQVVIRLSRLSHEGKLCRKYGDELANEYTVEKYTKAKLAYYTIEGNPQKNGYIEITIESK